MHKKESLRQLTVRAILNTRPFGSTIKELNGKYCKIINSNSFQNFHSSLYSRFFLKDEYLYITGQSVSATKRETNILLQKMKGITKNNDKYYST